MKKSQRSNRHTSSDSGEAFSNPAGYSPNKSVKSDYRGVPRDEPTARCGSRLPFALVADGVIFIDGNNFSQGNLAVASVLLLYYHLASEKGITNDQTVCLDPELFDGFSYLGVEVAPEYQDYIDPQLLREGAEICLLCDLNDMIGEYEDTFTCQPIVERMLSIQSNGQSLTIPEFNEVLNLVRGGEELFNYSEFRSLKSAIFEKYVESRFRRLLE